ncbi:hypothetical protein CWC31_10290 [Pseudoalteromonas ruthenica]|nr:hypothetical protein CWC31_10290 [Pseudoalteromonas ruthenica]
MTYFTLAQRVALRVIIVASIHWLQGFQLPASTITIYVYGYHHRVEHMFPLISHRLVLLFRVNIAPFKSI